MTVGPDPTAVRSLVVGPSLDGERVDRVVAMLCAVSRGAAAALVAGGSVRVDGLVVDSRSRKLTLGETVEVASPAAAPQELEPDAAVRVPVVFADEHVIVVDKPPGLVVHPGAGRVEGTLVQGLLAEYPELSQVGDPARPGIVHRLDAGTSGLLVVARTQLAYESLVAQLSARSVSRRYLALVWGRVDAPSGLVDAPVGRSARDRTRMAVSSAGREARTRYSVVRRFTDPAPLTLLQCSLETGRTHQIRVHLGALHHPVVGDNRYGGSRPPLAVDRPFLHAHRLEFDRPESGERLAFESALPSDLEHLVEHLH